MTLRIIGGTLKGRLLKTPKIATTRPTQSMVREALFNICQNEVEGAHFLDLFAGSGAVGFEALSRGATSVTFVERNREAIECIRENITALDLKQKASLLPYEEKKAIERLQKENRKFNIIYIDPPYNLSFDFSPISSLLLPHSLVFFESGQKELPASTNLYFKNQRKFGSSYLTVFEN